MESLQTGDISYKDISQLSEITDDVFGGAQSIKEDGELNDIGRLKRETQKKLRILSDGGDVDDEHSL